MKSGSMRRSWLTGLTDAIVLLGVLACLPWPAAAQSDKKIPGMSLGTFKVTNSGGAKHTIPITVSPGINGMEPKLSIVYDSQVQNRLLGIGWTLAGIPGIHRCPRTIAQDGVRGGINLNANDRFCLDSQRLMVINGLTYGADGAEYRTELDTFVRVFSNGQVPAPGSGPLSFTVKNKAGETLEFGNTTDSRIEGNGKETVRMWVLNKITDSIGNYMTITYEEDTVNGDFRPFEILYTGNASQGISPQRKVRFLYATRTDAATLYIDGSKIKTTKRLTTIQTYAPPPTGGAAVLVREYRMTYEYSTATGRTRLKTVTECSSTTPSTTCLPPHTFNWQDATNKFVSPAPQWTSALAIHDPDVDTSSFADRNYVGDFNGDGKADILSLKGIGATTVKVHLSTGTSFNIQTWAATIHGQRKRNHLGDFNGDGKTDILSYKTTTSCWLHLSTGSNFNKTSVPCNLDTDPADLNYVGDFNGDGKSDVAAGGNFQPFQVHLSTGTGFTIQYWPGCAADPEIGGQNVASDFNGDGMTDIATSSECVNISTGSGFVRKTANGGIHRLGDYNGDGKSDFVSNEARVSLFTGTDFLSQQWTGDFNDPSGENQIEFVGDFNGDGKTDVVVPGTTACDIFSSTGNDFIKKSAACQVNTSDYTYIGDFNGDGKIDILQKTGDPTKSRVNLSFGPLPDLLTSITNNLGGKIDITYKPITSSTVYTKDNDAVYPVMDVQAHIYRTPTYVVESHTAKTRADGTGQNFTYTYDYGGAKWHHLGRGRLGFRWMRVVDETALVDPLNTGVKRQTTNSFNQIFPLTGLLQSSETADTQNPLLPFSRLINTHTPTNTFPTVVFPALTRVDKSDCDKQTACLQIADQFTYDINGNLTLTRHLGNIADLNDQRDEVTEWIVDTANWIHRPKRTALLDSAGATVREKWLYYDDRNLSSQWGQLGTPPRGLVTREESRAAAGAAGDRGQAGNPLFTYAHDGFGNRTSVNNPINCLITTTFDSATRTFPATITNCLNHPPIVMTWDPRFGAKLTEQDPNHTPTNPVVTTYAYDTFGRATKVTGPLDGSSQFGSVTFNYNNWGNPATQHIQSLTTKDHGTPTVIAREDFFDGLGRFYKNESDVPGGATITQRFTYDSRGLVTEKFAHRFLTETELPATRFVYDVIGRETFVIRPDSRTAETQYLPGRITLFDENDHQKVKILDGYGQVREIQEKNGVDTYRTFYDFDAAGSLVHVENHLHHHTRIKYDLLGRKIALCDPNMGAGPNTTTCETSTPGAWLYTYDKAGNLLTQADAVLRSQNKLLTFQYDLLSRLLVKTYPSGVGTITHTLDQGTNGIGRLSRVNDLGGVITAFTYDKMGRITRADRTIDGIPHTLTMSYNALSKVTNETYLDDNEPINYTYDEAGRLNSVQGYVNSILYNARGQKYEIRYANNVVTTFDYFDQNVPGQKINFRIKNRTTSGPNPGYVNLQDLDYDYDNVSNMTSLTDHLFTGTRNLLRYDDLNRLIEANGKFGGTNQSQITCGYSYSPIGDVSNKCGIQYTYGDLNHPSFVTATSDGKTYTADLNGNTATGAGRTFAWTADNRAKSITMAAGTTAMDYDYTGARFKKFGPLGLTIYPFPTYEIGPDGVKFKYFKLGNDMLAAKKSTGEKLFYHNDHLGGINVVTDINAARTELIEYDPWGKISRNESVGTAVDPNHRFTGQELDLETDLYYYGGRYYDQQLARFVQPDPFVVKPEEPQNFNRYSYVLNNPYKYIDPTGYESEDEGGESEEGNEGEPEDEGEPGEPSDPEAPENVAGCGECDVPQEPQEPRGLGVQVAGLMSWAEIRDLIKDFFNSKAMAKTGPTMATPDPKTVEPTDVKMNQVGTPVKDPKEQQVKGPTVIEDLPTPRGPTNRTDLTPECAGGCSTHIGKIEQRNSPWETEPLGRGPGLHGGMNSLGGPGYGTGGVHEK